MACSPAAGTGCLGFGDNGNMEVDGRHYRTIWVNRDGWSVEIIDQTLFPHRFETATHPERGGCRAGDQGDAGSAEHP